MQVCCSPAQFSAEKAPVRSLSVSFSPFSEEVRIRPGKISRLVPAVYTETMG